MALKDTWTDKIDNQDIVYADDINSIAQAVINLENTGGQGGGITETVTQLSMTLPQISAGTFSSVTADYTPVYQNSVIVLDVIDIAVSFCREVLIEHICLVSVVDIVRRICDDKVCDFSIHQN